MSQDLQPLSKLALVLYPTNSNPIIKPLFLYSSVVGDDVWHLSLIGPMVPDRNLGHQETWWEAKWLVGTSKEALSIQKKNCDKYNFDETIHRSKEDLHKLAATQSLIETIENIRQAFSTDDIALRGYGQGNEDEIRLTIRYSSSKLAFDVPLARLNSENINEPSQLFHQKPSLNLLELVCEAYQCLRKIERNTNHGRSNCDLKNDASTVMVPSLSHQRRTESSSTTGKNVGKKLVLTSTQDLATRNLAHPCKKPRTLVVDDFLSSDESG